MRGFFQEWEGSLHCLAEQYSHSFVPMFAAGTAVLQGITVFDVAPIRQICGEEAAEYGDHDACEDGVPRHIEYVADVFTVEVRHDDVVDVE